MNDHAPHVKAVADELNLVRGRGPANLDSSASASVATPQLDEIAERVLPNQTDVARSLRITRLLQAGINELESASHKAVLTILFGLSDKYDKETPTELRRLAAKHLSIPFENFKRSGAHEDRILEALAAVLWHWPAQADASAEPDVAEPVAATSADEPSASGEDDAPDPSSSRRPTLLLGAAALAVLLVGGILFAILESPTPSGQLQAEPGGTGQGPSAGTTGKLFAEQQGSLGTKTYSDPLGGAPDGPPVGPLQQVQVSCKVYAVPFPSALPDGYFYRLESAPWFGRYYAVANSFLNGDPVSGTGPPTNTDRAVPDCPTG